MRKTPNRKIMNSLFKQYKKYNKDVFRFKATMDFIAITKSRQGRATC